MKHGTKAKIGCNKGKKCSQSKNGVYSTYDDNNNKIVCILKAELTAMDKKITSVLTQVNHS